MCYISGSDSRIAGCIMLDVIVCAVVTRHKTYLSNNSRKRQTECEPSEPKIKKAHSIIVRND